MIDLFKRLAGLLGFRFAPTCNPPRPEQYTWTEANVIQWGEGARNVANDSEYRALMTEAALNLAPHAVKARRLAQIARERDALKDQLAKAIKAKKARAPIYAALRALSIEELRVETGK